MFSLRDPVDNHHPMWPKCLHEPCVLDAHVQHAWQCPPGHQHRSAVADSINSMPPMPVLLVRAVLLPIAPLSVSTGNSVCMPLPCNTVPYSLPTRALDLAQLIDEMGVHSIMLKAYMEDLLAATEAAWGVARSGASIARERRAPWHTRLVVCKALNGVAQPLR